MIFLPFLNQSSWMKIARKVPALEVQHPSPSFGMMIPPISPPMISRYHCALGDKGFGAKASPPAPTHSSSFGMQHWWRRQCEEGIFLRGGPVEAI